MVQTICRSYHIRASFLPLIGQPEFGAKMQDFIGGRDVGEEWQNQGVL
jgi:hypothetical protein